MERKITSSSNSLIKHVKSLHRKKARWKSANYFVEGLKAVEEGLISKADIEFFLYSDALFDINGGCELFDEIKNFENAYNIPDKLLNEISDTENPQGIIAVVKFKLSSLKDVVLKNNNFLVILDELRDPGNMGTIIRTADALGANGIVVTKGCVDVFNPKTIRSTMGSIFHIPLAFEGDIEDIIASLKKEEIKIISTSLESSDYCYNIDFKQDFALIIGNEASGVSDRVIEISDYSTKIPMKGEAESLNAAIASGIVMYEASRQRQDCKKMQI
ncbi:TrmH family RNA methyltransferase [Sporosalibacterium faouarense]|uniref:TrmH family RNA methyltransferase n=1 Tax=Sporosalibacterium faouarense TaxID=516123 RepID=UPI00141D3AC9|nr:RNA methyltransferase [Sporosalibacterium faouarense]MTI49518.1 RNA methyltransferase [Bacillota bacterium]